VQCVVFLFADNVLLHCDENDTVPKIAPDLTDAIEIQVLRINPFFNSCNIGKQPETIYFASFSLNSRSVLLIIVAITKHFLL